MPATGVFDKQIRPRPSQGNAASFNQEDLVVAASQTINKFDIVSLSSSKVQQAIALPGSNFSASLSGGSLPILGIAQAGIKTDSNGIDMSSGYQRTTTPVLLFDGNLEFLSRVWNATPSNSTIANIALGTSYQILRWRDASALAWWYAVSTTSTNGEATYVGRYAVDPLGGSLQASTDQYGLGYFKAVGSLRQL